MVKTVRQVVMEQMAVMVRMVIKALVFMLQTHQLVHGLTMLQARLQTAEHLFKMMLLQSLKLQIRISKQQNVGLVAAGESLRFTFSGICWLELL